jgi:hypothetical protein
MSVELNTTECTLARIVRRTGIKPNSPHSETWKQRITKPVKLHLRFEVTVDGDVMIGTARADVSPASRLEGNRLT